MTFFYLLTGFVIVQRLLEVAYARSNEKTMRRQGAIEFGAGHYKWIVLLHVLFFLSLVVEVWSSEAGLGAGWQVFW